MSDRAGQQVQMNLSVYPELVDEIEVLAKRYDWSKREVVTLAVQALTALMDAHEAFAAQLEDDVGGLYVRLAAEAPAGFIEAPKDGIRCGYAGDVPAVMVDKWLVFADRETGALLAEEQGGEGRIARLVEGEIKPIRTPTADEVALNYAKGPDRSRSPTEPEEGRDRATLNHKSRVLSGGTRGTRAADARAGSRAPMGRGGRHARAAAAAAASARHGERARHREAVGSRPPHEGSRSSDEAATAGAPPRSPASRTPPARPGDAL